MYENKLTDKCIQQNFYTFFYEKSADLFEKTLPHDGQRAGEGVPDAMDAVVELVEVGAVGQAVGIPVVAVVGGLEHNARAVAHDEFGLVAMLDALDDELVVVAVAVGGDDVGNLNGHGGGGLHRLVVDQYRVGCRRKGLRCRRSGGRRRNGRR